MRGYMKAVTRTKDETMATDDDKAALPTALRIDFKDGSWAEIKLTGAGNLGIRWPGSLVEPSQARAFSETIEWLSASSPEAGELWKFGLAAENAQDQG
jgi:hypothetical protein